MQSKKSVRQDGDNPDDLWGHGSMNLGKAIQPPMDKAADRLTMAEREQRVAMLRQRAACGEELFPLWRD